MKDGRVFSQRREERRDGDGDAIARDIVVASVGGHRERGVRIELGYLLNFGMAVMKRGVARAVHRLLE